MSVLTDNEFVFLYIKNKLVITEIFQKNECENIKKCKILKL